MSEIERLRALLREVAPKCEVCSEIATSFYWSYPGNERAYRCDGHCTNVRYSYDLGIRIKAAFGGEMSEIERLHEWAVGSDHVLYDVTGGLGNYIEIDLAEAARRYYLFEAAERELAAKTEAGQGWVCPVCGRALALWVESCSHGGQVPLTRTVTSDDTTWADS